MENATEIQKWLKGGIPKNFQTDISQIGRLISIDRRLRETGTFKPAAHMRGRRVSVRILRNEENILNCVDELNPETSTSRISVQTGITQSSSWRTLNDMGMSILSINKRYKNYYQEILSLGLNYVSGIFKSTKKITIFLN